MVPTTTLYIYLVPPLLPASTDSLTVFPIRFKFFPFPHTQPLFPNSVQISTMSPSAAVELDFFRLEKDSATAVAARKSPVNKLLDRRCSFRDIQSVISKINPELLKTVIAGGSAKACSNVDVFAPNKSFSVPTTPKDGQFSFPALPVYNPVYSSEQNGVGSAPLTIFYNGTVSVFDVSQHQAENILKIAQEECSNKAIESKLDVSLRGQQHPLARLNGDLPIARKLSLQRFLEKRKERLVSASPYGCPTVGDNASSY